MFELRFTVRAQQELTSLEHTPRHAGLVKQVRKTLGYLQSNPKHPSLQTHSYSSIEHPYHSAEKVFEAYAQNNTPSAYRVFWCYGPERRQITSIAITPHS